MLYELRIPRKLKEGEAALDHARLFSIGLKHVEQLASQIWTDYNVHDPGITTLELLCYALTDLSYRAAFPLQDLLSQKENPDQIQEPFVTARKILTNHPLTILDYRKLLIDLKGVKNAWIRPAPLTYYADNLNGELFGPASLFPDEVLDLPALAARLKTPNDPVSQYIAGRFPVTTHQALSGYEGTGADSKLQAALVRELNRIIGGISIYDKDRFAAVPLSPEVQSLTSQVTGRSAAARLNRLLLEDAYPIEISRNELLRTKSGLPGIVDVEVAGLYEVTIEFMDGVTTANAKQNVMKAVRQALNENRNLCEDFVHISEIEAQEFILCAELELAPDADVVEVYAQILFQVQNHIAPDVPNYTLDEMLERKKPAGEIFDGPVLQHGFIENKDLLKADLPAEIRLSDIMSIIMDIPGVQAIRDIVVNPAGTTAALENKWTIPVAPLRKALLDREKSRLVFYKGSMPIQANSKQVKARYGELAEAARKKVETEPDPPFDFAVPKGKYRNPEYYYSFQRHFPAVYGIGETGLPSSANEKRRAQAMQLKAYLLFYDQILANYFAQLGHIRELFSMEEQSEQTYFYQPVTFAASKDIYTASEALESVAEEQKTQIDRRNRFLDHLIARFAERFNEFVHIMHSAFGSSAASMVAYRCEFLKSYAEISSSRGLAYNYTLKTEENLWNSANVSGLEKRLARLLGIPNFKRRNLANITNDENAKITGNTTDGFRFHIEQNGNTVLSSKSKYSTKKQAKRELQNTIRFALLPSGYQRKISAATGKHSFSVVDQEGKAITQRREFGTEEEMNQEIENLMEYLRANYSDEGMYLIENILLRPAQKKDPLLPICRDPNCTDCAEADPYSYRIHIVLPAYSSRFSKMDFRRCAEEIIRSETPAHILPKICWVSEEDMVVFEKRYFDWISLKAGAETAQRIQKLTDFIEQLFKLRSVYPSQKLYECDAGEDNPKFILGQTSLGTMPENDD